MNRRRNEPQGLKRREGEKPHQGVSGRGHGRSFVAEKESRLIDFLLEKLSVQKATAIKQLLKHGCIEVDGQSVTRFDHALFPGMSVQVVSACANRFSLNHPGVKILYEDESLIAVEKASGVHTVDTTGGGCENVAGILDGYLKRRDSGRRIYVVHRLDRDTSGVLIFAKSREAQNRLVTDWNERIEERCYIAVVEGAMPNDRGTVRTYLYEDERKVVHCTDDRERGVLAVTHYCVLSRSAGYTRVRLDLETGRTNQIRVHMQHLGHPVAGDAKYGAATDPFGRLGLHAMNIRFRHPMTGREMSFSVPEPACFGALFNG